MKRIWQPICFTALTLFWACGTASNDEDTSDNTYNEDSGTGGGDQNSSGNMHETDASTEITDTAGDTIPGNSGDCTPDATSCDGIILLRCINGSWQQWDDCSIYGKVCTVQQGVYQCVSVGGGADTGLDTTDESDADSVSQSDSGHRDTSDTASWRDDSGWNADSDTGRRQDGETDVDTETDTGIDMDTNRPRAGCEAETYQSNHEGELIDHIHRARGRCAAIIINPGAFTHYAWAIHDALAAFDGPVPLERQ